MPPLIAAVIVGAGAYAGFRIASHVWSVLAEVRADGEPPQSGDAAVAPFEKDLGALELDPATGVYRPRRHD